MKITTEAQLEKYGREQLKAVGCLVYKFTSPAKRGVPDDLIICPDGYVFFIEYKHPNKKGKLSKLQIAEHKKITANNVAVSVVDDSVQVDSIASFIEVNHCV